MSERPSGEAIEILPLLASASGSPTTCHAFFSPVSSSIKVTVERLATEVTNIVVRTQLREAAEVWRKMADQVEQLDRLLSERGDTQALS
jgi:hypothetical protein